MNPIFANAPTTIFDVMSGLAREHDAINLGQGFPDDPGPLDVREKAADRVLNGWNQYPPMMGLPELRHAIADHYRRFQDIRLDAMTETMVTSGATEALAAALIATISPGDEVILFQPMYDAYLPLVLRAGGVPRFVNLRPPHWTFERSDLEAAFSSRTRALVFNNPLNPTATVFEAGQIALIAEFCERFNVVAISDEVWEHLRFDGRPHVSLLSEPRLRDRTIKIGSAGKIFSLTGWKVGLVAAAPPLLQVVAKAHQFLTFTTAPNLQAAVAYGLAKDEAYFTAMRASFQRCRDRFVDGMESRGFKLLPSHGTYFVNVDISESALDDVTFSQRLVREYGVASIPVSAFYAQDANTKTVRFCFAKNDATIDEALVRLRAASRLLESSPQ